MTWKLDLQNFLKIASELTAQVDTEKPTFLSDQLPPSDRLYRLVAYYR